MLETDSKMFCCFLFSSQKYYTNKKKVYRKCGRGMTLDCFPGSFHVPAPVNVVKHKDARRIRFCHEQVEIVQRWFFAMIAVDESKADG